MSAGRKWRDEVTEVNSTCWSVANRAKTTTFPSSNSGVSKPFFFHFSFSPNSSHSCVPRLLGWQQLGGVWGEISLLFISKYTFVFNQNYKIDKTRGLVICSVSFCSSLMRSEAAEEEEEEDGEDDGRT